MSDAPGDAPAAGSPARPAYYAARPGRWRDWWTLLHPPYTAWHLSYVVLGAALAPHLTLSTLLYTLGAFFLAVGVAAHALDELHGRPLRTQIPAPALVTATVLSLCGALGFGVYGFILVGWPLIPFMIAGPLLVVAYNAELFGGIVHTDLGFGLAWGGFPVLTGYLAQAGRLAVAPVLAAVAAVTLSLAQRSLSTPARALRRRAVTVTGRVTMADGQVTELDQARLLAPLEQALRTLSWSVMLLAAALAIARLA
ncbi:MAG: hypothetical protein ACLQDY_16140 [Streptosporangiaceae bacterium]